MTRFAMETVADEHVQMPVTPTKGTNCLPSDIFRQSPTQTHAKSKSARKQNENPDQIIDLDSQNYPKSEEEDIKYLIEQCTDLSSKYRVIEKIGSGAFSIVYKAQDLQKVSAKFVKYPKEDSERDNFYPLVAIKKLYASASPKRILRELSFLQMFSKCPYTIPIVDAMRFNDQILVVSPYCDHVDFRHFYRDLPISGIKVYMYNLFSALSFIHKENVIHRDVKPSNFLYNPRLKKGVLVDFGLAEQIKPKVRNPCPCVQGGIVGVQNRKLFENEFGKGIPKNDTRFSRRASRAGTRGFRAPEVLFKCRNQSTKIDIWAAGVILLCIISRRYPFFESVDDEDAIVELTAIFGVYSMKQCAALHGLGFSTNLTSLSNETLSFAELVYWILDNDMENGNVPSDSVIFDTLNNMEETGKFKNTALGKEHRDLFHLLRYCMYLNYGRRFSAEDALNHPFFNELHDNRNNEDM